MCHDRTERSAAAESIEATLANEPIENADKNDPMQPTDSTEPTEPIERIEPREPMLKIEFSHLIERRELLSEPMRTMMTYAQPAAGARQRPLGRHLGGQGLSGRNTWCYRTIQR